MARMSMLIDLTRCIGCDACTIACKQENGTPVDVFFARVLNIEAGKYPNVKRVYVPVLCNHCDDAPCLKSCPNKAIIRRPDGIVLIDQDRCKGTGACVAACPYGNVYLYRKDEWYMNEDEPYERDFVKPRLNEEVARKCTYCSHRVDQGLDPACVVACPTTARIFGDTDDENSVISKYIEDQKVETGREPFRLLPEAKTKPAGMYLGTMSSQESATLGGRAGTEAPTPLPKESPQVVDRHNPAPKPAEPASYKGRSMKMLPIISVLLMMMLAAFAFGSEDVKEAGELDAYSVSNCMGCHGMDAMGGMGPPLIGTKMSEEEWMEIIRDGKGMMPGTTPDVLSDEASALIYQEMQQGEFDESAVPLSYKVGQLLSTRSVGEIFSVVGLFALIASLYVLRYWMRNAGYNELKPAIKKFGTGKAFGIVLKSLIMDGFLVQSLWKKSKHRWAMHAMIFYGFIGLMVADVLIQVLNPTRSQLEMFDPLKMLPMISGVFVILGISYVFWRYKKDEYIDNGLTLGKDFLFVNLILHAAISGFLVVMVKRGGGGDWLQAVYIYHLVTILLLMVTWPFTRGSHVFVVPFMAAMTRLTEAISVAGVDIGFDREPSPGRHHKSLKIANQVIDECEPGVEGEVKLRYYP